MVTKDADRHFSLAGGKHNISLKNKVMTLCFSCGFHATAVYRLGQYLLTFGSSRIRYPVKILLQVAYGILNSAVKVLYGINIDRKAVIGEGFYIGHFGGISVGECSIGKNCSIHQQVRIVGLDTENPGSGTKIGDNVWIGAHSKIESDVIIEDNVTVGAGSVVKKGMIVKEKNLVMGNPARVIKRDYDNSNLLGMN